MRVPRQQVSAALFNLLKGVTWKVNSVSTTWATADPRMQVPDDLGANQQPALFLVKPKESISQQQSFQLPIYRLKYFALILVRASATPEDTGATAENIMDNILDAIESAMGVQTGQKQTLNGLVENCWIDGDIQIDTPVLFENCAIWVPMTVSVGV